uniref:Testis expressed 30 n=1 Tax=Oryzias melastigma TaxID=30732 RepID=A0A3B3C4U2_ORYME
QSHKEPKSNEHLSVPATAAHAHTAVMLTHGAGADMNFKHLVSLARALASNGFLCLRFTCRALNLVYRVKAYHAAWNYLKSQYFQCPPTGRSMGGRAAAALASQLSRDGGDAPRGLICLSFPLHPPAQTQAHLQRSQDLRMLPASIPVLFVSGTEDDMCDPELFNAMMKDMEAPTEVLWLQGGRHGLTVRELIKQIHYKIENEQTKTKTHLCHI